jgi:hypothetical protein
MAFGGELEPMLQLRMSRYASKTLTVGMGTTNFPPHCLISAIVDAISLVKFHGRIST